MIDQALPRTRPAAGASAARIPEIRRIGMDDLRIALTLGWSDFRAAPSQLFFLCIIYPVVAVVMWRMTVGHGLLPLFYPLISGFALVGPIAALGLYEISMRREHGQPASWINCFDVLRSPALSSIVVLALALVVLFVVWIATADALYHAAFGDTPITLMSTFADMLFETGAGWMLIVAGNLIGFLFAALVLAISVVSFPMMLDRNCDVSLAVRTSVAAVLRNRRVLAAWGLIVALLLALGSAVAFVGLAIVLPVLGHATWHLYRRLIAA